MVIFDGFGISYKRKYNAVYQANMKNFKSYQKQYSMTRLNASESSVGLPPKQCGNSEVGHTTIGAGRIVKTGLPLLNDLLFDNKVYDNQKINEIVKYIKKSKKQLHLVGIYSSGNVHGSYKHINKLIEIFNKFNVHTNLHLLADGRDTFDNEFIKLLKNLKTKYLDNNKASLISIGGRYFGMDRDQNWKLIQLSADAMSNKGDYISEDFISYLQSFKYSDYTLKPVYFNKKNYLKKGDVVVYCNYRSDRIKQLIHYHQSGKNYNFNSPCHKNIQQYSLIDVGANITTIFDQDIVANTLCKTLVNLNNKVLRVAETEKKAHVTYFMDGMQEYHSPQITNKIFNTNKVDDFSKDYKMKAKEITTFILKNYQKYSLTISNYANLDMVGHTGNFEATVKACQYLDAMLKKLVDEIVIKNNDVLVLTADHGNAEEMQIKNKISKKHSTNKIPFLIIDKQNPKIKLLKNKSLANIANTILSILDYNINIDFEKSIIKRKL